MNYKLNKIALALSLLPLSVNIATANVLSEQMYQSELDQLEMTQLTQQVEPSQDLQSLFWTKNTNDSDTALFSCVLTTSQSPYAVKQQNSFEACVVNNFDVEIINDQLAISELAKLSIDDNAMQARSFSTTNADDTILSEHIISWLTPQNRSQQSSLESTLKQGFVIELPSRDDLLINQVRIYPSASGFSVQGKVDGDEYSNVFLHFNGQYWNGSIHSNNEVFTLTAHTEDQLLLQLRRLTEFDEHDDVVEHDHEHQGLEQHQHDETLQVRASGTSIIDIVVVYSTAYANSYASNDAKIRAAIETRVAEANVIYQNSNIDQKIVLLGYKEISLKDNVRSGSDVAQSSEARAMRDEYGADLVSFWTVNGSAGSAQNYSGSSNNAYNTSRKNDIETRYTFVHELGHSMGAKHDRQTYVEQGRGNELTPSLYKYGKSFTNYRTVMSYDNCPTGNSCNRIMHFTNPRIDYRGTATGIAYDPSNPISDKINGPADNARRLNETRASIANFKTRKKIYTDTGATTPTPVRVTPTPISTPTPIRSTPTPIITPTPVTGDMIIFIPGKTQVSNGDVVTYKGNCFQAKNNPGVWETPSDASWFWTPIACQGDIQIPPTPKVSTPTPAVITPTPAVITPTPITATPTPVVITPTPIIGDSNWSASQVYNKGDTVIVNGITYIAGWWTKGEEPGTTGQWGVWKAVK
ncbi:hypothetical protein CW745_16125 [Psychromonas sp. psych-6C06]|uniref:M12 family metallo-peptidase n=1 Tax=Psychromonas sp. psych-6C06 TaxID=2058089 RepID=UPI000C33E603|nr:M12 family metallo-peptidase [Psychromonas sp. psych-6C06]PKF60198.1 hypothetical protein CW745_16125 [Psychromonas sp. psych-6C06]